MPKQKAQGDLVVTGYLLAGVLASLEFKTLFFVQYKDFDKATGDIIDRCIGYEAVLLELQQQYDLEVLVKVDDKPISLCRAKALYRRVRKHHKLRTQRLNKQSTMIEASPLAQVAQQIVLLRGIIREGMGTRVTITDPQVIEHAKLLGLRD